jgi:hypothetical protein
MKGKPISQIDIKQGESHFWKGLMEVRDSYQQFCKKQIGDVVKEICFWNDVWVQRQITG